MSGSPGGAAAWPWSTVEFFHPNPEPSRNRANQTIIGGGLPIGNGETAALVFPVVEAFSTAPGFELRRGVHLWLGMTTAMASDAATMPLGVVSIETYPPIVATTLKPASTRLTALSASTLSRK